MPFTKEAIEILRATEDGNRLTPAHLKLLELAINGALTAAGEDEFARLHQSVISGEYFRLPHWFHGIEHLTKDHQGYVYWKGRSVEHYSFRDPEKEAEAAQRLADRCVKLESLMFPVNSRTVLHPHCYESAPGTPWKQALCRYYAFFRDDEKTIGIFYRQAPKDGEPEVFSACRPANQSDIQLVMYADPYSAFHALQGQGLECLDMPDDYGRAIAVLAGTRLAPTEIDDLINRPLYPTI